MDWHPGPNPRSRPCRCKEIGKPIALGADAVGLSASAAGDQFAAALDDGRARVWSAGADGKRAGPTEFHAHTGLARGDPLPLPVAASGLALSPDGRWLAAGTETGSVVVFDVPNHRQVAVLDADPVQHPVTVVRFSADGHLLAAAGIHGRASLWRVGSWPLGWTADVGHNGWALGLTFSSDGQVLAGSGTEFQDLPV